MAKPSNVRERLVAAALSTFHTRGFNGSGVQDIADAAGVPKGSFYNYFESKEALGAETVERYWQDACEDLRILSDETIAPVDRLRRYFDRVARALEAREYACGCLLGNLSAELPAQSRLVRDRLSCTYAAWTRAIENCVRDAQKAGQTRVQMDAGAIAAFLVHSWQGAVLRTKVDRDGKALEQFKAIVFSTLFE